MTDRSLPSRPATLTGVVRDTTRRQWMRWSITGLALAGAALWLAPRAAQAAPAPTVVEAVQLPAWVERHGQRRPAQPGIKLRHNDKAVTAAQARMLLRLPDRSEMKLGEATEMVIEDMSLQSPGVAQPKKITSVLRLITACSGTPPTWPASCPAPSARSISNWPPPPWASAAPSSGA